MSLHFSERFGRYLADDDWLDRREAAEVLSKNSGRTIYPEYLQVLVQRGELHPQKVSVKVLRYQYKELRYKVVNPRGGPVRTDNPTSNALRQREYRRRQRLKKASQALPKADSLIDLCLIGVTCDGGNRNG